MSSKKHCSFGAWTIKAGREDEFRSTWSDLVQWTAEASMGASEGVLVQDSDDPRLFYSFMPFESMEAIEKWRLDIMFKRFMMRMRAYCEACRPSAGLMVENVLAGPPS